MSWSTTVRLVLISLLGTVAGLVVAAPAHAGVPVAARGAAHAAAAHTRCATVEATGTGQDLGNGQTTATVSVGGVTVGTTSATFTITGSEGTTLFFEGPITFTGLGGTLTANVTGTLDAATGDFTSTSTSVTGTRSLRAVTGDLTFSGHEDLVTGDFTESITGNLCLTVGHRR
jgi:hypothetical protein